MTYKEVCLEICKDKGKRLRERRRALGIPLKEVGYALGVSYNTVYAFEHGQLDGLGFYVLYSRFLNMKEDEQNDVGTD